MIMQDGYHDFAVREPLPSDRIYPWRNTVRRIFHHSLEGRRGSYKAYNDPARYPTGWTGTVAYDGKLYQHAPVWAGLAHGGPNANPHGPGYEAEGVAGEPLTAAQVATYRRIHADISAYTGITYVRDGSNRDFRLVEHGEAAQTACPSGRYAPLWEEEEPMTPEERAKLDAVYAALTGGVDSIIQDWVRNGNSLLLGYALEQGKLADHLVGHGMPALPDHEHESGKVRR